MELDVRRGSGGCIACKAIRIGESVSSVSMLVGKPPESPRVEGIGVVLDELVEQLVDVVGVGDQAGADAADDAAATGPSRDAAWPGRRPG